MKTFNDLEFKKKYEDFCSFGLYDGAIEPMIAKLHFKNGYSVSVITGHGSYSGIDTPYELAVLDGDSLTYNTPITDDVEGNLTEKEVTELMKKIQEL